MFDFDSSTNVTGIDRVPSSRKQAIYILTWSEKVIMSSLQSEEMGPARKTPRNKCLTIWRG